MRHNWKTYQQKISNPRKHASAIERTQIIESVKCVLNTTHHLHLVKKSDKKFANLSVLVRVIDQTRCHSIY